MTFAYKIFYFFCNFLIKCQTFTYEVCFEINSYIYNDNVFNMKYLSIKNFIESLE